MSKEEIEKAKSWLSALDINSEFEAISKEILLQYIEKLEQENKKLDKMIDEMAKSFTETETCPNEKFEADLDCENRCSIDDELIKECWKQYFEEKVEGR